MVYTTHYMEEVEALCGRVSIMDHGKLVANDTLDGLLQGPDAATAFRVQLEEGASPEAMEAALVGQGSKVKGLEAERGNLEQVFLELTGHALRDGDEAGPAPAGEVRS